MAGWHSAGAGERQAKEEFEARLLERRKHHWSSANSFVLASRCVGSCLKAELKLKLKHLNVKSNVESAHALVF